MRLIELIDRFMSYGVAAVCTAAIVLILLRVLFNYMDANPFSRSALTVRRLTDPGILPLRRALVAFRVDPKAAPVVAILAVLLIWYVVFQVCTSILNTAAGVLYALQRGVAAAPVAIIGYLLYGFLGLYVLLIFVRIIFSWVTVSYGSRLMRFLVNSTEPLLAPMRRMIPTVGRFDISPIVAFIVVWILQAAVAGTLLRDWPVRFF